MAGNNEDSERNGGYRIRYPTLYAKLLQDPNLCSESHADYRKPLLQRDSDVEKTYTLSPCEALQFVHTYSGVLYLLLGLSILGVMFVFGVVWSKFNDPVLGWTIAVGIGQFVVAYIGILFVHWFCQA